MIGTVLALGGGGFSVLDEASPIDDYLLRLTGKDDPKVCFVPTASGDADPYIESFLNAFEDRAQTSILSLFCHDPWGHADPTMLLTQDIVYVGGGSTANLLAVWRLHGLPDILQTAAANGTILAGISAGMICWFEQGLTDSFGDGLEPLSCLGWLPGSACPHFDGESERKPTYLRLIKEKKIQGGIGLDDGAGALFVNEILEECVSSRISAKGFLFDSDNANEHVLSVRYLG